MPLFEFECRKCGERFEELMAASEAAEGGVPCPSCGSKSTEKALSAFATGSSGAGGAMPAPPCGGGGCGSGGFT